MKIFQKKYLTYALFFAAGSLLSGGVAFAANGTLVQALYQYANIYVSGSASNVSSSQLIYNGVSYINTSDLVQQLDNAGAITSWDGQTLSINNLSSTIVPPVTIGTSGSPSGSTTGSAYGSTSQTVSLFDFPQFAVGQENKSGSTAIYSSFVDNLGNRYFSPTMSWDIGSTSQGATTTGNASSSQNGDSSPTLGNTLGTPYGTHVFNHNINFKTFHAADGTSGTFSKIYNLLGNYTYFTATLAPSAYFNYVQVNNNIGSLEVVNAQTGAILYDSGAVSSSNFAPVYAVVPLTGVNQIKVIFTTDGLGLINPILIK